MPKLTVFKKKPRFYGQNRILDVNLFIYFIIFILFYLFFIDSCYQCFQMMATGGRLRDSDVPDIYSCAVCMEHLLDRNPRYLSCHHSFCQQCLQRLTRNGQVSCPTCKAVTAVPNNDVTKLTMNFQLVQTMEREKELKEENRSALSSPRCMICSSPVANKCGKCKPILQTEFSNLGKFKISNPTSIKALGPDLLVYSDYDTSRFVVFDNEGAVIRRVKGKEEHGKVKCVDVYKNRLYLAQEKQILCITNFNKTTETELVFVPKMNNITQMAVKTDNILVCTERSEGRVYEYNTEHDSTRVVLQGLKRPTYISVGHTPQGTRFILTLQGQTVMIYNESWQLLNSISHGIRHAHDTAPCQGGFLLADIGSNEITLYSYTGDKVRTVLTKDDGLDNPASLTLQPYTEVIVWVAGLVVEDRHVGNIKCFKNLMLGTEQSHT